MAAVSGLRLGVTAAVKAELGPTLAALRAKSKRYAGRTFYLAEPLVFTISGIGAPAARQAAEGMAMIREFALDALVSTGFAGAVADGLSTGDLVIGDSGRSEATEKLVNLAQEAWPQARTAQIATVDRVVLDAKAKRELSRETGAAAVDMESRAVAEAAKKEGLGFLCVKVILDTPAEPLASGYESVRSVLAQVARRPGTLARIAADAARARAAARRLADFFVSFAQRLKC